MQKQEKQLGAAGTFEKIPGIGNFVQVVSAAGLLNIVDNNGETFLAVAGFQGTVRPFQSLQISSTVDNDIVKVNIGKKISDKDGVLQESAIINESNTVAAPTRVLDIYNGTVGPFEGDGTNLFSRPAENYGQGSYGPGPHGWNHALQGETWLVISLDGSLISGTSDPVEGIDLAGNTHQIYMKDVDTGNVVTEFSDAVKTYKLLVQGFVMVQATLGNMIGTGPGGTFNIHVQGGFVTLPALTF